MIDSFKKNHLIFIHNPKCAGKSIKEHFGFSHEHTIHDIPHKYIPITLWKNCFTFTCVRHPFDRFLSGYFYHTNKNYQGTLLKIIPNLHELSLREYFECVKRGILIPQVNYIEHQNSSDPIDYIIKFESLKSEIRYIETILLINHKPFPHLNKSKRNLDSINCRVNIICDVNEYYKEDYEKFNYNDKIKYIIDLYL